MFPHDVQVVEGKQKIVATLIRLEARDGRLISGGQPLDLRHTARLGILEIRQPLTNGKISLPGAGIPVPGGKSARQKIEARSDAVDD